MPKRTSLTDKTFFDFVKEHRCVVIHFWAAWNGQDELMKRMLESEFQSNWPAIVRLGSLDADPPEHDALCRQHGILNLPFLAFYRNGRLVETLTGMHPLSVIAECLQRLAQEEDG